MSHINLGKPYDKFIKMMIDTGYYESEEEVLRDALREKMQNDLFKGVNKKAHSRSRPMDKDKKEKTIEFISDLLVNMKKKSDELKNEKDNV
jgi:putative addiction module CopG family antidote